MLETNGFGLLDYTAPGLFSSKSVFLSRSGPRIQRISAREIQIESKKSEDISNVQEQLLTPVSVRRTRPCMFCRTSCPSCLDSRRHLQAWDPIRHHRRGDHGGSSRSHS